MDQGWASLHAAIALFHSSPDSAVSEAVPLPDAQDRAIGLRERGGLLQRRMPV
ncbi:hypothetical protein [Streptomyces sp. NBC_00140]|uniref:hypothetical protein n=1 Tax=Streptomyces sp. NBC_00140 TaxID=2975664 RepID=UPI0022503611|nr:hypothetical protein [Streptomyces sp. NBC_00140]MCX5332582.1 hypothetical protein [Streptomyces sp. NBC_00140]